MAKSTTPPVWAPSAESYPALRTAISIVCSDTSSPAEPDSQPLASPRMTKRSCARPSPISTAPFAILQMLRNTTGCGVCPLSRGHVRTILRTALISPSKLAMPALRPRILAKPNLIVARQRQDNVWWTQASRAPQSTMDSKITPELRLGTRQYL